MNRLHLLMLANAVMVAAIVLAQIWGGAFLAESTVFRLIGSGIIAGLYLSFIAVLRMDFAALESKNLGYAITILVSGLAGMALVVIWDLVEANDSFLKIAATLGVLLALAFYLLSIREDLIREKRQRDNGFLD